MTSKQLPSITIESGVPVPEKAVRAHGGAWGEILAKMNVGDSFAVPDGVKPASVARAVLYHSKRMTPTRKFVTRKGADGARRCWRTE